ncbi:MAG TPA: DUF5681 domain-containing protein [Paludibacter sp.]
MGQHKGQTGNPNGRPKGQPNKATAELRERIKNFLDGNFESVQSDFQNLEPVQKLAFYEKLIKYVIPVQNSNELKLDFEKMSDSELDQIINRLINN